MKDGIGQPSHKSASVFLMLERIPNLGHWVHTPVFAPGTDTPDPACQDRVRPAANSKSSVSQGRAVLVS